MSNDVTKGVYEVIGKHATDFTGELSAGTRLEEIGMESLEVVECIFDLEEMFDITIPNPGESDQLDTNFKTVADVINAVTTLVEAKDS